MVEIPTAVLGDWSDAWGDTDDRLRVLEAAIRAHRQATGVAYGIGSFRAQAAANRALWALVEVEATMFTGDWELPESGLDEAGLARPAHLEDDE